jgi:hypothetical protein
MLNQDAIKMVDALFSILDEHVKYFRVNKINNHTYYLKSKREWAKTFFSNHITAEEIKKGVDIIRTSKLAFDDLLPCDFINLCRQKETRLAPYHADYVHLTHDLSSSREIALENLKKMKQILGK